MPVGREGSEVDYAVNFHAQDYNLPMSYVWRIPPTADANPETTGKWFLRQKSQSTQTNLSQVIVSSPLRSGARKLSMIQQQHTSHLP